MHSHHHCRLRTVPVWTFSVRLQICFQLEYEYRTAPGRSRDVTTGRLNFRYDHAFYLTPTRTVVTRSDLPLLPIVGFRVALPEISTSNYLEPILRYDVSVAGDPTRRNISNLQFVA